MHKFHLVLLSLLVLHPIDSGAQNHHPEGNWEGKLQAGIVLRLRLRISSDSTGRLSALMDSPDQGARNIPCGRVTSTKDSLLVEIPLLRGRYAGKWTSDSTLDGEWTQGRRFPLDLKKIVHFLEPNRPQRPRPPFPYLTDSVQYEGKHTGLHYGATITRPAGKGPFPAVILITGSGPQNRDEELFAHRPFAVLADYLTRRGFLVLRADDRGVGQSTGSFSRSTTADFALDVEEHLDYLLDQPDVNKQEIGLIGHSEGGLIAPMVAAKRKEIRFVVLLAGPGIPTAEVMALQNAALQKKTGVSQPAVEAYSTFYRQAIPATAAAESRRKALNLLQSEFDKWKSKTPSQIVLATTGVHNDSTEKNYCQSMVRQIYTPWFRYFIQIDPRVYLHRVRCPLLALNGSEDIQVVPGPNLNGIYDAMKNNPGQPADTLELPGLNHLFQECRTCTVAEYGELEQTFSPKALATIGRWLTKTLGISPAPNTQQ